MVGRHSGFALVWQGRYHPPHFSPGSSGGPGCVFCCVGSSLGGGSTDLLLNNHCMAASLAVSSRWLFALLLVLAAGPVMAAEPQATEQPLRLRIQWGGGEHRPWQGRVELLPAPTPRFGVNPAPTPPLEWSLLSSDATAAATIHRDGTSLIINGQQSQAGGGIDLHFTGWPTARLRLQFAPADGGPAEPGVSIDGTVAALLADETLQQLDARGNRLRIAAVPGDLLRLKVIPPTGENGWQPADVARVVAQPLLPSRPTGFGRMELNLVLADSRSGEELVAQAQPLVPVDEESSATMLQAWQPVAFNCPLPAEPGHYRLRVTAIERSSLRWSRELMAVERELVVSPGPVAAAADGPDPWELVYELDPGSPRLHERLRRLPGQAAASMASMRRLSLPAMPMPSLTRAAERLPSVSLPKVPLPSLPKVPSVDGLMPTFSGLLATGDSTVQPHPLGAMLTLPPAAESGVPTWEGIVIADAVPGRPHAVEVAYPSDQQALVGVSVLERSAAGSAVELRYDGGIEVPRPLAGEAAELRWHRFVFWPRTRSPLLVLTNPSSQRPATVGSVRVLRGRESSAVDSLASATVTGRKIFAPLPRQLVAAGGAVAEGGNAERSPSSWVSWYDSLQQTAQRLRGQQVNGLAVEVHAGGASLWESDLTAGGPLWDGDPDGPITERGDRLDLLCRVCRQQGMQLVPTLRFDGPLPQLEALLTSKASAGGLLCVGRDGQVRDTTALAGGRHYNILDPRVQDAVASLVAELTTRLAESDLVDGVGVVLPYEGWLHLPGVAWGLDDVTFERFVRQTGQGKSLLVESGPGRFATRAAAVEGQLRPVWLSWRADQIATFHRRLAGLVAAANQRWNYYVMPTSLLFSGESLARFQPHAVGQPQEGSLLYEMGLDPGRLTVADNAVYVTPRMHAADENLADAAAIKAVNQSPAIAAWESRARRRGLLLVEQQRPLALDAVVPHGPFAGADGKDLGHFYAVAGGPARQALLVTSLTHADAEVVFDHSLRWADLTPDDVAVRAAFQAVPRAGGEPVAGLPAEFPVRVFSREGKTWLALTNATRLAAQLNLRVSQPVAAGTDVISGEAVPIAVNQVAVELQPWSLRLVCLEGESDVSVDRGEIRFAEESVRLMADQVAELRRRQAVLDAPPALPVLDNPGFDLPSLDEGITGWELVETPGGRLELVEAPRPQAEDDTVNRAARLSSAGELATARSNPFEPPATGRASIAVWLRIPAEAAQPPLRVALEGRKDGEEYYRFAPVGAATGGRPLTEGWTQFVLQVTDLPTDQTESLRLRFDMLGPGVVEVDEVQVFDLVFADSQRAELRALIDQMEHSLASGAMASLPAALEGYWPRFLAETVTEQQVETAAKRTARRAARRTAAAAKTAEKTDGFFDRMRNWWR